MTDQNSILDDLNAHLRLANELLALADREAVDLRTETAGVGFAFSQERKRLLPELATSLEKLRRHRVAWQRLTPAERAACPEVAALLRENQELIMKVLNRDRENEQHLLRRGLVPTRHQPPAARQRPHFVADLYRRHIPLLGEAAA